MSYSISFNNGHISNAANAAISAAKHAGGPVVFSHQGVDVQVESNDDYKDVLHRWLSNKKGVQEGSLKVESYFLSEEIEESETGEKL